MAIGYEIYFKAGSPAVPGVDVPQATVGIVDSASFVGLTFNPDAVIFSNVWAINDQGRATLAAETMFATDANGKPRIVPSPVRDLRATPLAGGLVQLDWTYDEFNPLANAAFFVIDVIQHQPGGAILPPDNVPYESPRRNYSTTVGPLPDGHYTFKVYSVNSQGQQITALTGVIALADATGPPVPGVSLEAA